MKWTSAINTLTCFHKKIYYQEVHFKAPIDFMPDFCQIGVDNGHTFMKGGKYTNIHQSYTCKLAQHMAY